MVDNRITKQRIKNHWHYSWWKYALMAIVCVLGVNLIFAVTAYRPPEDRKVELYMCSGYANTELLHDNLWPALLEAAPEQELLTVLNIDLTSGDMYSSMQFSTYIGAQEGDVCLLPVSQVRQLTAEGGDYAFLELTPYIESGLLNTGDIDLAAGTMAAENGKIGVYAIPADGLYGLIPYGCDPADSMLCVMAYTQNAESAVKTLDLMLSHYTGEKPEGYDAQKAEERAAQSTTQLFR